MANMTRPLLDLNTLIERPQIAIDGESFEILSIDELSAVDHQRMTTQGNRLDDLMGKKSLSRKDEIELSRLVIQITDRIMVGVPDEVRAKLTDRHRMAIAEVFTMLLLKSRTAAAGALTEAMEHMTGATSQPGSSDSMAAAPQDG